MLETSDRDNVRDATDLVQLIGEHVALKARGREHVGLCPFHDDHSPSLAVVTHKSNAFYKCHSCGAAGDAFTFVQQYHKMDFSEALRYLADRAGITLTFRRRESTESNGPSRFDCRKANDFAREFYQKFLLDPQTGAVAREIIEKRGISEEMVSTFALGVAPDQWDALEKRISIKPSAVTTALAAGLLKERNSGDGYYDTFRNRLMFPIFDETGNTIAFGARILDPEDNPKYLNSPESSLFNKSRTLYGLHLAKRTIIDSKIAIITEGYTDVIACHQAGFTNAVGTLGTALTRDHATILGRLCDTVIVVFDGDEAGQRAANRAVEVFFSAPVDVKICVLPDGLDPDEMLQGEDGPRCFQKALDASRDALDYKVDRFQGELVGLESMSGRQKHLESFLRELADLGFGSLQGVRKRLVLTQLSDLLGVTPADIESSMPRRTSRGASEQARTSGRVAKEESMARTESTLLTEDGGESLSPTKRARRLAEREFLALVIFESSICSREIELEENTPVVRIADAFDLDDFADPASKAIVKVILPWITEGRSFSMQQLLAELEHPEVIKLASSLYFEAQETCGEDETALLERLTEAVQALFGQIQLDRYESKRIVNSQRFATGDPSGGLADVIKQIDDRKKHGNLANAIVQGLRSS